MLKDKKILYLVTQTKWGGAQKYVLDLAAHFAKNNQVHIAYGETDHEDQKFLSYCQKLGLKTFAIKYLKRDISPSKDFLATNEIFSLINKEKYNLIHLNSSKVGLLGTLASVFYGFNPYNLRLRVVYTAHGFVFNEPLSPIRKSIYKMSETVSTSLQSLVIAVSDFDRQSAIDNKVGNPGRMFTVHNGIDAGVYHFMTREQALDKMSLPGDKKYFGTIASFYETKGHKYLVDAVEMLVQEKHPLLDNYRWVFVGDGPLLTAVKDQVSAKNLDEYIRFVQPDDEDWKKMSAFDAFILPSVKEGLPYTILEAGLARVPVIASKVGGIPEIISDQKTGLLTTPANPLSLAEAIKKIVSQTELCKTMTDENYDNIKNNFSLRQTLNKTEELYLKLF